MERADVWSWAERQLRAAHRSIREQGSTCGPREVRGCRHTCDVMVLPRRPAVCRVPKLETANRDAALVRGRLHGTPTYTAVCCACGGAARAGGTGPRVSRSVCRSVIWLCVNAFYWGPSRTQKSKYALPLVLPVGSGHVCASRHAPPRAARRTPRRPALCAHRQWQCQSAGRGQSAAERQSAERGVREGR